MKTPDFSVCNIEEVIKFTQEGSSRQLETTIDTMSPDQVSAVIEAIDQNCDQDWKLKVRSAIIGINSRELLEAAGKSLSLAQAMKLINTCLQVKDKHHWKLSPLLVGMPHELFSGILTNTNEEQLQVFKDESVTEPVQHHLTTLSHKLSTEIQNAEDGIDRLYETVQTANLQEMSLHDIREIVKEIEFYQELFEQVFEQNNKALAIAWNTNRLDIIETFNKIKDCCQKYTIYGLGFSKSESEEATGLYLLLEQKLCEVYGDPLDADDSEAVKDSEPVMEGLVKHAIWYLRDYWEMGLLPKIKDLSELDLDLDKHSENERIQHREKLFAEAQMNLSHLGLKTVKDLKNHYIFSKQTLQEYIQEKMPSIVK